MEKANFTLGVDVSRNTLDIYCIEVKQHIQVTNNAIGFKAIKTFCKVNEIDLLNTLIVLEYTGGYEYRFIQFCESKNISYVRVPGLEIKRSMGIVRGKSDKIDSKRIAQYGDEKYKQLTPGKPINKGILELKMLLSFRKKLIRENAGYKSMMKERKHMYEVNNRDVVITILNKKQKENEKAIEVVEQNIERLILCESSLLKNYELLKSIRGIGNVNAWMTLAYTENFTSFNNARSYAVYVGVIPFEYSSGISIRGRKRVSKIANKELKQELNQAAKSAIQWDKELNAYATKKLENKHYGVVLNNVKFKLILRMFSVVKRGEKYIDNYCKAA